METRANAPLALTAMAGRAVGLIENPSHARIALTACNGCEVRCR